MWYMVCFQEDMDTDRNVHTQQLAEDDTPDDSEANEDGKHEEGLDPQVRSL